MKALAETVQMRIAMNRIDKILVPVVTLAMIFVALLAFAHETRSGSVIAGPEFQEVDVISPDHHTLTSETPNLGRGNGRILARGTMED